MRQLAFDVRGDLTVIKEVEMYDTGERVSVVTELPRAHSGAFHASPSGKTFHTHAHNPYPPATAHRAVQFRTYAEAVASGRTPCRVCRPVEQLPLPRVQAWIGAAP